MSPPNEPGAAAPVVPACCRCKYWVTVPAMGDNGTCRRYPPGVVVGGTAANHWCGEFTPGTPGTIPSPHGGPA